MHAGTFLGGAWGRVWVFVFGFLGIRDPGFWVLAVLLCVNVLRHNVSIACKGRLNLTYK